MLAESLALMPGLGAFAAQEIRLVTALRLWVMMAKRGHCPLHAVGERLGSLRAAAHLHLLLEEIGMAWPEPFRAAPPCCSRLSPDEVLVIDMVRFAGGDDRPGFDRLLAEMLPGDVRDRLCLSAALVHRSLAAAMR